MLLSEGQMSDFGGAALMIDAFPKAKALLGDRGYDADWFREALAMRKIEACVPSKSNRKIHIPHDVVLHRQRHKIEIMFERLKDWRRIHTRYDRCAHTFMFAICIHVRCMHRRNHNLLDQSMRPEPRPLRHRINQTVDTLCPQKLIVHRPSHYYAMNISLSL
jgi:transposase